MGLLLDVSFFSPMSTFIIRSWDISALMAYKQRLLLAQSQTEILQQYYLVLSMHLGRFETAGYDRKDTPTMIKKEGDNELLLSTVWFVQLT